MLLEIIQEADKIWNSEGSSFQSYENSTIFKELATSVIIGFFTPSLCVHLAVVAAVHNGSTEMVEAFCSVNRLGLLMSLFHIHMVRDESSSLDALLALANLPTSMLPTSTVESGRIFCKLNENRITCETDEESSASEAASIGHHRDKTNHVGAKEKNSLQNLLFKLQISNPEAPTDFPFIQSFDNKDVAEEVNKNFTKVPAESELDSLPNKHQSRCKMNLKRLVSVTFNENTPKYTFKNQPNKQSLSQDRLKDWIAFQSLLLRSLQKQILNCNLLLQFP
ncbi:hypothetical protein V6N11_007240 [Hibiscus sabdariffa]|uniref:Uncharacterized protein n=1 Tax=Hibiscus sabdariffa TaxID=183260 RepID=A0ABR2RTI1_9ROSI